MTSQLKWSQLSPTTRILYLKAAWYGGYSEAAIAKFFGITKNTIVGRRNRLGFKNTPERRQLRLEGSVDPEHFWKLVEAENLRESGEDAS